MRIALVSPWPPEASGIANYAVLFAKALEKAGARVVVPLPDLAAVRDRTGIQAAVSRLPISDVDLVHFELGGGRVRHFLVAEQLLRGRPNVLATATVHDPERLTWRSWGLARFERLPRLLQQLLTVATDQHSLARERLVAASFRRLVTLTEAGADALQSRMRLSRDLVQVIPHGGPMISPKPPHHDGPLRVICFGFLHPGKGIEDLIDSFALNRQERPELNGRISLTIAGGSRPTMLLSGRNDYVGGLRASIRARSLTDQVTVRSDIAEADIPSLIHSHDLMVLPYRESRKVSLLGRYIGSSGALSWAIACGRGALVTDTRALAEDVAAGNGAVYRQGNIVELATWLARLAADRSVVRCWADNALTLAGARSWAATAERFLALFGAVMEEARARRESRARSGCETKPSHS